MCKSPNNGPETHSAASFTAQHQALTIRTKEADSAGKNGYLSIIGRLPAVKEK